MILGSGGVQVVKKHEKNLARKRTIKEHGSGRQMIIDVAFTCKIVGRKQEIGGEFHR